MMSAVQINPTTGLLESVLYLPSPHCDDRPTDCRIDMIVVHGISLPAGNFGTDAVAEFFTGTLDIESHPDFLSIAHLRVSAHLFIRRDGGIVQFVPFNKRAWHAGESSFKGRTRCNDFSIGIELEGTDHIPYELIQYTQLANVIRLLRATYPDITADRIVGHVDIAPGRKTDPGPVFDWAYLRGILA